ncbi:MAG: ABC transporter ATP-binding protein [Gammaproteobacteria bacterium]
MIEVSRLSRSFGDLRAVDDLSFTVKPGEVLGFLGPNGAGKSTTMKMIAGFIAPSAGSIRIFGRDVQEETREAQRLIGYLPEGAPSYEDMQVVEFLRFIASVRGFTGAARESRVDSVVAQMELGAVRYQRIETLSKGFKRRVGLGQAILHDPQALVLDEPTDGLDPNQKHQVRELIRGLSADKIVVISTHILEEVHAVCNRAIIIAGGKLVADGTPADLEARSPLHRAVHLHLAEAYPGALAVLESVPGVREVRAEEGGSRFLLLPQDGSNPLPAIARLVHDRGWVADDLHVERGRLDEVFRSITREAA